MKSVESSSICSCMIDMAWFIVGLPIGLIADVGEGGGMPLPVLVTDSASCSLLV